MKQHPEFVKRMMEQGNIAVGGIFPLSDPGELRGVEIFRVGPEQTAQLVQGDPLVKEWIGEGGDPRMGHGQRDTAVGATLEVGRWRRNIAV